MLIKKLGKARIFLFICISYITGVGIASFFVQELINYELYLFSFIFLFFITSIIFWGNKKIRLTALLGLFLFLGIWRYVVAIPDNSNIYNYYEQQISFTGTIVNEVDKRSSNIKFETRIESSDNGDQDLISEKVLVFANKFPVFNYGDRIKVECKKLSKPEKFSGFSYDRYLARYDIYLICYFPEIELVSNGNGSIIYTKLLILKNKIREVVNRSLKEPHSSIIRAMIIGDKSSIPDNLRDDFSKAGISHVVAISGMHIGIISFIIMTVFLAIGISRKNAYYFSIIFLLLYVLLIGAPASAVRAGIMGFLVLTAIYFGRMNKLFHSLVVTAAFLLLINPKLLRDDIGFQLSFLAVIGIALIFPKIKKISNSKLKKIRDYKYRKTAKPIIEIIIVTLAAQIFTMPIIIYNFRVLSLISPVANLLILWTLPFIMVLSFLAIILGILLPYFSVILFTPAYLFISYILLIVELLNRIPFSSIVF